MSEDMNKKLQQIAELLGQETMPENVKSLLSLLSGSLEKKEENKEASDTEEKQTKEENTAKEESTADTEMFNRAKKLAGSLNTANDPRINLLYAIKPFMNSKRQKKIGNCIQLLQMSSLTRLLENQDK